ncbi:MAG: hypothetical protein ABEH88_11095 [Halobacteriales archaeon]
MSQDPRSAPSALVESYEYGDLTVIAIDLGPEADPTVDVVDGIAILVVDGEQREFELPSGAVQGINSNGVVTFEVDE